MKLSTKISGILLVISMTGAVIVSVFAFAFLETALRKSIGAQQMEIAGQTMDKIDRVLYERIVDIQSIGSEQNLSEGITNLKKNSRRLEKRMMDLTQLTGPWDLLHVAAKNGTILSSSNKQKIGRQVSRMPAALKAFEEALKGTTYISDYFVSDVTGKPAVLFATPVRDDEKPGRPVVGAVLGYFAWPVILEIFEDMKTHAVLINDQGEMIGHNSRYGGTDSVPNTTHRLLVQNYLTHHNESIILRAEQSIIPFETFSSIVPEQGYLSYKGNNWHLVLEMPTSTAFGASVMITVKLISLFILVIVLMAGVVLFMMKKLVTRPIEVITLTTQEIADGDLSKQIGIKSNDEIGKLAASFNSMTAKLRESYDGMERKIEERSKALIDAQAKLLRSEKMSAVGQLSAGIAHEINNPLGVIIGFAQGLASRLKPGDSHEIPIKAIEREALRCKTLVQDLLSFSRTSMGEREPQDLNAILEGGIALVQTRAKMESVTIERNFSKDLPMVQCNQNQIHQVVVNLANNACDAMPKGGKIRISTALLKEGPLSWISLKISDSGAGIPSEVVSKIFEPFFTTKEAGKGTGLGLSLVYDIIQKHSGSLDVQSRPGETEFHIKLPVRTGRELEHYAA